LNLAFATLVGYVNDKSCVCRSYRKHPGVGTACSITMMTSCGPHTNACKPFALMDLLRDSLYTRGWGCNQLMRGGLSSRSRVHSEIPDVHVHSVRQDFRQCVLTRGKL